MLPLLIVILFCVFNSEAKSKFKAENSNQRLWKLLSGTGAINDGGVYTGPAADLRPGPRSGGVNFVDNPPDTTSVNRLWLFGGFGCTTAEKCGNVNASYTGILSDMWAYDFNENPAVWKVALSTTADDVDLQRTFWDGFRNKYTANHKPRGREGAAVWTWNRGNFVEMFMFGGIVFQKIEEGERKYGYGRDLWGFDTRNGIDTSYFGWLGGDKQTDLYTWKDGKDSHNETIPGCRYNANTWVTGDNHYYLYGGTGFAGPGGGGPGRCSDLWRWEWSKVDDKYYGTWTLVRGPEYVNAKGEVKTKFHADAYPGGYEGSVTWLHVDPDYGDEYLYLWGGRHANGETEQDIWIWSIAKSQWKYKKNKYGHAIPHKRRGAAVFKDVDEEHQNYVFLFGGIHNNDDKGDDYLNDMWGHLSTYNQFDRMSVQCCGGPGSGNYLTDATSYPSKRVNAHTWVNGAKWYIFGGDGWVVGPSQADGTGNLNDFWEFSFPKEYRIKNRAEQLGPMYVVLIVLFVLLSICICCCVVLFIAGVCAFAVYKRIQFDKEWSKRDPNASTSGTETGTETGSSDGEEDDEETELV